MISELIAVIYGNEISIRESEAKKFKGFLVKMGVQWEEGPAEIQRKRGSEDVAAVNPAKKKSEVRSSPSIPVVSPSPELPGQEDVGKSDSPSARETISFQDVTLVIVD